MANDGKRNLSRLRSMKKMVVLATSFLLGLIPLSVYANTSPTIVSISASPNPIAGTTTTLAVEAADDGGASNLTYTWATVGTPPAPVRFSNNNSNAAQTTTATFSKAGSYVFQVTVKDSGGLTTTKAFQF